jgi:hypothetical protein
MTRRTAWTLLAISAVFVVIGVLMLTRGAPEDRIAGLGCATFFGAGVLVGAIQLLPRRKLVPDAEGVLTLMPDKVQTIGLILGAAAMSAGCFFIAQLAAAEESIVVSVVGWIGVALFGLGAPAGVWRLLRLRPLARLDREGVRAFGPMGWSLAWRDITGIDVCTIASQRFIAFDGHSPAAATLSDRANDALDLPRYMLGVTGTAARFEDLHALALSFWSTHRGR